MKNRLKIEFRHKQLYKDKDINQPIVAVCNPDGTATYIPGTVPGPDWVDMTQYTEGLKGFKLSWTAMTEDYSEGDANNGASDTGSNYNKGVSLELRFFDVAFKYIYDWMMTDPCQILNSVEARVTDLECGKSFRTFELKLENTKFRPGTEPCIVSMPLREKDDVWHSFQKTIIEDNWQGWFNRDGSSTKDHPTFPYIVEKKPKMFLSIFVVIIYLAGILGSATFQMVPFIEFEFREWVRKTLSVWYYCPSPLIRTYIQNICDKYGFTFNTMFDDDPANPYRDLCLFWPVSDHYTRFNSLFNTAPSTKYLWENRTVLSFTKFLNQLKKVFNAEWYITPNSELVFQHKSYFDNQPPLYDFTAPGADELFKLEYTYNGKKKPAYGNYQYAIDPQDSCSNEIKWRYNAIVDFDGPNENPMLEGSVNKYFDFAMTAFHNDGTAEDYLEEGIRTGRTIALVLLLLGLGQLFLTSNLLTAAIVAAVLAIGYGAVNDYLNDFFDNPLLNGCVRTSSSEINMPRLLMWDRSSAMNFSKVVWVEDPAINPRYNTTGIDYYEEHPAHESNVFGTGVTRIYNYPMYVDELFLENLYDRFHDYDNPLQNPVINQNFEAEIDLCCPWMDRLGVWDGDYIKVGSVLILEERNGRLIKGRLTDIEPNYDKGNITLKGKVLK